jgi:hypothetical protein
MVSEGLRSTPTMNLQLLELSNKRATGNIIIHKHIVISVLRKNISTLSRPVHGFESRTRCQATSPVANWSSRLRSAELAF